MGRIGRCIVFLGGRCSDIWGDVQDREIRLYTHGAHYSPLDQGTQTKKWYHALRLFSEAERVSRGLEPRVYLEGEIRDHIMRVREGHVTGEEVQRSLDELQISIDKHVTALPAQADVSILGK